MNSIRKERTNYTREAKIISKGISNAEREVNAVIDNYTYLNSRLFVGDLSGAPYLYAFEEARLDATLTPRQNELLDYFLADMSTGGIGIITGKKRQNIARSRERIVRRLAYHFKPLFKHTPREDERIG